MWEAHRLSERAGGWCVEAIYEEAMSQIPPWSLSHKPPDTAAMLILKSYVVFWHSILIACPEFYWQPPGFQVPSLGERCCESCTVRDPELHLHLCPLLPSQAWLVRKWPLFYRRRNWSSTKVLYFSKTMVLANSYISLEDKLPRRWLSNFSMRGTCLRCLSKCRSLYPAPKISASVGAWEYAFSQISSTPFSTLCDSEPGNY